MPPSHPPPLLFFSLLFFILRAVKALTQLVPSILLSTIAVESFIRPRDILGDGTIRPWFSTTRCFVGCAKELCFKMSTLASAKKGTEMFKSTCTGARGSWSTTDTFAGRLRFRRSKSLSLSRRQGGRSGSNPCVKTLSALLVF